MSVSQDERNLQDPPTGAGARPRRRAVSPAPRQQSDAEWGPPLGGSVDIRWADIAPGTVFVGIWQGTQQGGKYTDGLLEIDGTVKVIAFPKVLQRRLGPLPPGTRVRLVYLGMSKTASSATPYHDFEVRLPKGAVAPPPVPREDEEVDF
jgi:hypothetical protein